MDTNRFFVCFSVVIDAVLMKIVKPRAGETLLLCSLLL